MHLYFIFSKNVSFFQDLKYNVHLRALWEGDEENELEAAKRKFSPSGFFLRLILTAERTEWKPSADGIC